MGNHPAQQPRMEIATRPPLHLEGQGRELHKRGRLVKPSHLQIDSTAKVAALRDSRRSRAKPSELLLGAIERFERRLQLAQRPPGNCSCFPSKAAKVAHLFLRIPL